MAPPGGPAGAIDWSIGLGTRFGSTDTNDDGIGVLEWNARFGAGVEAEGLQLAAGLAFHYYGMVIDDSLDTSLDDSETAPYFRAAYRADDSPVTANLVAIFGEIDGFSVGFGFHL
jgi:hypothetical protein